MKSIIKTNQPEVGHGIGIFDPTNNRGKIQWNLHIQDLHNKANPVVSTSVPD